MPLNLSDIESSGGSSSTSFTPAQNIESDTIGGALLELDSEMTNVEEAINELNNQDFTTIYNAQRNAP